MTTYQVSCQKCSKITHLNDKPVKVGRESPVVRCMHCKQRVLMSAMKCVLCDKRISKCECNTTACNTSKTTNHNMKQKQLQKSEDDGSEGRKAKRPREERDSNSDNSGRQGGNGTKQCRIAPLNPVPNETDF